jgi:hypothetical protein
VTPKLDRIPSKPDPVRLRSFNLADRLVDKVARSYTWRCDLWLDQQNEGACVPHAWTHEAAAKPVVVSQYPRPGFTSTDPQSFAFEGYDWCRRHDEFEGEDYEGTSVAAGAKWAKAANELEEYLWTHSAAVLAVGVSRLGPAVIGVDWYGDMFKPNAVGLLKATGEVAGGHCILVNGYSIRTGRFRVHNSWGRDWGFDGEAEISYDDMDMLLSTGGEACLPLRRHL